MVKKNNQSLLKFIVVSIIIFLLNAMALIPERDLKIPNLLNIQIGEILLFLIFPLFLASKKNIRILKYYSNNFIFKFIFFIIILIIFRGLLNIFEHGDTLLIFKNIRRPLYYLLYFAILLTLKNDNDLFFYIKVINVIAIVGGITFGLLYFWGINFGNIRVDEFNVLRVRHPILQFSLFASVMNFSLLMFKVRNVSRVFIFSSFIISSLVVFLSFFRTYYLIYFFVIGFTLLYLVFNNNKDVKKKFSNYLVFFLIIWATIFVLSVTNSFESILNRFYSAFNEISYGSGTFYLRYLIWIVRYNYIMKVNPLLGIGFIQEDDFYDKSVSAIVNDPSNPSNDNGFAAVLVLLGLIGIFTFVFFYFVIVYKSLKKISSTKNTLHLTFLSIAFPYFFALLVTNFSLDNFIWVYGILPNLIIFALLTYIFKVQN